MDTPAETGPRTTDEDDSESEPPPRLSLETVVEDPEWPFASALEPLVDRVASALSREPSVATRLGATATACVAFASDEEVRALNGRYRGQDKPTNVLSFAAPQLPPGMAVDDVPRHLGDVVLARETVAAEAHTLGISIDDHLQHLVVHGVLHLLGYDHATEAEADDMEALETRLLASLGVADPYRSND